MKLDRRTMRLIAVGASITANCQPCLQTNVAEALKCGVGGQEIAEAIGVGKLVRRGAASKMDQLALSVSEPALALTGGTDATCDCGLSGVSN